MIYYVITIFLCLGYSAYKDHLFAKKLREMAYLIKSYGPEEYDDYKQTDTKPAKPEKADSKVEVDIHDPSITIDDLRK